MMPDQMRREKTIDKARWGEIRDSARQDEIRRDETIDRTTEDDTR